MPSRYRSSTNTSSPFPPTKASEPLQRLLDSVISACAVSPDRTSPASRFPAIEPLVKQLRQLQQYVAAPVPPSPVQDDFRHLRGFQRSLEILRRFSGFYNPQTLADSEKRAFFDLLGAVLELLSAAFRGHPGNRRYFRTRIDGDGWEAFGQTIGSIGLGGADLDPWTTLQLFGKLFSFCSGDPSLENLCCDIFLTQISVEDKPPGPADPSSDLSSEDEDEIPQNKTEVGEQKYHDISQIEQSIAGVINPTTTVHIPEAVRIIVDFWELIPREANGPGSFISLVILKLLSSIISASNFNLCLVHETGVLSRFLRVAFSDDTALAPSEQEQATSLSKTLMSFGLSNLADYQKLILNPSVRSSEFCLDVMQGQREPPFIQFDLSLHGHSSIELPSLGRQFPPQTAGYTLAAWVRVDQFDPKSHTTLFGAFDSSQTCFLLTYLEKDTRNFILQTSVTSSRPSVRFKSFAFEQNKWYHIVVVHRRPRPMTFSKASLYVNGEFVEQLKAAYPAMPPASNASTESFASFTSSSNKNLPVQAFLGTPKELSGHHGRGLIHSKWSLASAHLFDDVLSDEFLAVPSRLGPRYQGNFQDCLGAFQTYTASAALGLHNDLISTSKDGDSDIMKVIRFKGALLIPETKVLLSMMPSSIFRERERFSESQLFQSLSRGPANTLVQMVLKNGTGIAINTALPSVNEALLRSNGVAILSGDPIVATPQSFDDGLWRLAGFAPLALKIVERASTPDALLRAVEMVFRCINASWRNSDAMENGGGYPVLSYLLRIKLGFGTSSPDVPLEKLALQGDEKDKLCLQLLSLVLEFIGYNHRDPLESIIINPLAYRILLIDFDGWRKCTPLIQELYYKQFVSFAVKSKFHQYNNRRLTRMRVVKRLLDAVKAESLPETAAQFFMQAINSLVTKGYNTEVHRTVALFVTYALHTSSSQHARTPRPASSSGRSPSVASTRRPTVDFTGLGTSPVRYLNRKEIGKRVLEIYTQLLCQKGNSAVIRKFAKTVTNKWLLYLLTEDDPEIVVHGCKILARLLVIHGSSYTAKFSGKNGGFGIMAHRLKRSWDVPTIWPICFSMLFGFDVAEIDFDKNFDFFSFLETFGKSKVANVDVLPIITGMLQHGLNDILKYQDDPDSPPRDRGGSIASTRSGSPVPRQRGRSMSLRQEMESRQAARTNTDRVAGDAATLQTVIRFLADLHTRSADFRDFALVSDYVRLLLSALYPALVNADPVSPDTELNSRDSALTFDGGDVIIRPVSGSTAGAPVIRTSKAMDTLNSSAASAHRGTPLRKASSFILLTSEQGPQPSSARLAHVMSPKKKIPTQTISNTVFEGIMELVIGVFTDQLLTRKEFPGFGLFLKVPPGFQEHQAYFESYILRNTISHLSTTIKFDWKLLNEPKVLTNMSRFSLHMVEAIFEGWFMNGTESMLDFAGMLLEYLQKPEVSRMKAVRLCSQAVSTIRSSFLKLVLLRLSEMDDPQTTEIEANFSMERILYWQMVLLESLSGDDDYMKLLWYQLYTKLVDTRPAVRLAAVDIWRIMLVQKPEDCSFLFRQCLGSSNTRLTAEFQKVTELDTETFVKWVDEHRPSLDMLFFGGISRTWEEFVAQENSKTTETARSRLSKRKETLRRWQQDLAWRETVILRHDMANVSWVKSIYVSEHFKYQRLLQDQQDDVTFSASKFAKMQRDLTRPGAALHNPGSTKWKLDRTEGRNRMRLRLLPDSSADAEQYQPKRKLQEARSVPNLRVANSAASNARPQGGKRPGTSGKSGAANEDGAMEEIAGSSSDDANMAPVSEQAVLPEDDYELVEDPNDPPDEGFEDKNRRVMRRLEQGDMVMNVFNVSRIIGLEASEGILLISQRSLYLMDDFFQRADGEIVNAWEAPSDERDPFSQIVTGSKPVDRRVSSSVRAQDSRSWKWHDVLSLSKRRFLFRDVAIEIFFTDGRSYLLTAKTPTMRDQIFGKLSGKTPHTAGPSSLPNPDDAWRLESIKVFDEGPQTLGSRFGSIFNQSPIVPITRKWQKGEMSNFHYLMLINTIAGRTFNDLTQYPVFPWVLADYTSEELNLDDPRTFRDLSKPMGAQTRRRQLDYTSRYESLAEIGETPFHYGTHYSSAMIVASYLIRLPPFVHSYILLQGGAFDHADRLFYSIEGSWRSASQDNGSDVRELIPEFFCLPEFLTNVNQYNFGDRQGSAGPVDDVELPPWAKGDPKIFIAKHREALESPYVSQHLNSWIDLVFGHKQRGEAAVDNLNVFHYLSYSGAKDLDNITDSDERNATTSIIHNFGQTPHQVFTRSHPARENPSFPAKRLDTSSYALSRIPHPLLESRERVASLTYSPKLDRLLCSSPFRINLPPFYDKYLEWGFADNSLRFFFTENRKSAGINENLHIGQISCVVVADSKTLITAGEDCVVTVHKIQSSPNKPVELVQPSSLFGHKTPVTIIAVSRAFSTLLSVSADGCAFLWDLNRLEFIRKLPSTRPVDCARINDISGEVMLCTGQNVTLYTLNGDLILDQNVCGNDTDDFIHACAFYEGGPSSNEWLENFLVFTGHRRGRVNIWRRIVGNGKNGGKWQLEFVRRLDHVDARNETGDNTGAAITCISPMPQLVYTGDDDGRVYEWNLINRER